MAKSRTDSVRASHRRPAKRPKAELPFANYSAATAWLMDRVDVERTRPSRVSDEAFKLDRLSMILAKLGQPQEATTAVHVAGTNGKGSTLAMVEAVLREAGCTVGTYTSPHLTDLRERIQINGTVISHPAMAKVLSAVAKAAQSVPAKLGVPTFFELMTASAFLHFAEQAVDVALIEVGLGGRLDATNLVKPTVTAVAGIDFDHQQFLGDSLDAIAREKGGIFKAAVPALTFKQDKAVIEALSACAEEAGTELAVVGKSVDFSFRFESSPQLGPHFRVGLATPRLMIEHLPVPLPGEHQAMNCGLSLAIVDRLIEAGIEIKETHVYEGMSNVQLAGRSELVSGPPRILLDGAHNPAAVQALVKSIGAHVAYDSMVMIFGCALDKDVDAMLGKVALGADKVIFTKAKGNPRAAEAEELRRRFEGQSSKMCQHADTLDEALSIAARAAGRDDLIVVTGSFYLVGEARKMLRSKIEKAEREAEQVGAA